MRAFFVIAFALIISFMLVPFYVGADQKGDARNYNFSSKTDITKAKIWADFLNVAFSDDLWNQDKNIYGKGIDDFARALQWYSNQNWDLHDKEVKRQYERQKLYRPWYADYMYRPNGWPRHNVIHKWKNEISIGFGWPAYSPGNQKYLEELKSLEDPPPVVSKIANDKWTPGNLFEGQVEIQSEFYPIINEELENIIPSIQEASGLKTSIVLPNNKRDFTEDYARIRIIPVDKIQKRAVADGIKYKKSVQDYDPWLWGGILFETSDLMHMDGFLLPKADNTLGLAVCRIALRGVTETLFRGLVRECIVRAVGLPSISHSEKKSLIGDWRNSVITNIKNPVTASGQSNFSSHFLMEPIEKGVLAGRYSGQTSLNYLPEKITSYDRKMISLLYCKNLKSGMDKHQALRVLTQSDSCKVQ